MGMDSLEILNLRRELERTNIILSRMVDELERFNRNQEKLNGLWEE